MKVHEVWGRIKSIKDNAKIKDKHLLWLISIFILIVAVRLLIAFQTPLFNYDAYFNLRQIENIKDTGFPLFKDPLSYGGKTQLFAPLDHYILAAFSLIMPLEIAAKIIPNITAGLLIFVVYYLSLKITKNNRIALTTAFMSGFLPILFIDINRVSVNYLAFLLMFLIVYCMLRLNERKYVDYALIYMFLLVLTTPMAFLLVIGLLLYLVLLKLENYAVEMKELEIILFFTFLVFWVNLLIYKNAFLTHGLMVVWQNIPVDILSNFFVNLGFIQVIAAVSVVPIILGVYAFYASFHLERSKEVMILVALGISSFILLWFKLLDFINGLIFLSLTLVILAAYTLKRMSDFIDKSRIHRYIRFLHAGIIILFIITVIPSIISIIGSSIGPMHTPPASDVDVLKWAAKNTPQDAVIMSGVDEGNMVAYYAKRKNVMDTNFLLTPRIDQRLKDVNEAYTSTFETRAISIMNEYNAQYLLVTQSNLDAHGIKSIPYLATSRCFVLQYQDRGAQLYRTDCKIE